ncbi:MAG: hypothetical protein CMA64_10000 [Euryarchaeota archaeon]|jgi:hypothetical protein|nr:hypothetical protein [Euryarchaeota archaeon]
MLYEHENYRLVLDDGKSRFYKDGQLMFQGDGYVGIKFMVQCCDSEEVTGWFKNQLETREKLRWKKEDENKVK